MRFLQKLGKNTNKNRSEIEPEDIFLDSSNLSNLDSDSFEGRFEKNISQKSFYFFALISIFIFTFFTYTLTQHQVINHAYWNSFASNNYLKKNPIFANRGVILDRNGEVLAWNENATSTEGKVFIPKRFYVTESGLSSTLGYLSYPKKDIKGIFWQSDYKGDAGLEKKYDKYLSGVSGESVSEVAVNGSVSRDNVISLPISGSNLQTNIDLRLQKSFYNNLKEVVDGQGFSGGSGVMMDVNTGEVISLVSYPDFDNNIFSNAASKEDKEIKAKYLIDKKTPMLNRAASGMYVPGSVVKPFMAYAALKEGVIDQYQNIFSSGQLVIKNKYDGPDTIFRDWKAHGYVDVRNAIAVSSDEYFYQVGGGYQDQVGLGINRIEKYMKSFGFASSTGVDLPQEKSGVVPGIDWKKKNFEDGDWLLGNTYHTSIGQYGFQTTPLELARSVALIANGGKLIIPKIASTTENTKSYDDFVDLNLDKDILNIIREGMELTTTDVGTAHYFKDLPFKVAAKTGTAQLGFKNERVNSWSTGYFPAENPKYVFVFMMEGGPSTNKVGASKMMRKVFQEIVDTMPEYTK